MNPIMIIVGLSTTILLTCLPSTAIAERTVSGRIVDAQSRPVAGLLVEIWDEDDPSRGHNDLMGQVHTDVNGSYVFSWPAKQIWDPPKTDHHTQWRPDIFIRILAKTLSGDWVHVQDSKVHRDHPHRYDLTINATVASSQRVVRNTQFNPAHHGFAFENKRYVICGTPTCKDEHSGLPYLTHFPNFEWTLCGGMSLNALARFRNGVAPAPLSPELKREFIRDQHASLIQDPLILPSLSDILNPLNVHERILNQNVLTKFMLWQARPTKPGALSLHTIGHMTKQEWPIVKNSIDANAPILLGLIRVQSNTPWHATNNHQVLAIGYSYNELSKDVQLSVYDPNYPGFTSTIGFNVGLPENQIKAYQTVPSGHANVTLRGLFANSVGSGPPLKTVYAPPPSAAPRTVQGVRKEPRKQAVTVGPE